MREIDDRLAPFWFLYTAAVVLFLVAFLDWIYTR
jgi:hypothetical protein